MKLEYFENPPLKKWSITKKRIPETMISDNGAHYSSAEFNYFAEDWEFTHIIWSPKYPQSNGEVGLVVQTTKNLLTLENGFSPAELCMRNDLQLPTAVYQSRDIEDKSIWIRNRPDTIMWFALTLCAGNDVGNMLVCQRLRSSYSHSIWMLNIIPGD